jgi:hypothetical protein
MPDVTRLREWRERRFFEAWDGFVPEERICASEASIRQLIDDLLALGPAATETAARRAVDECVRRFNDLDNGWICTIERETIGDSIYDIVERCGFEWDEDWLDERDW